MQPRTHLALDPAWCGTPVELREGTAEVELLTHPGMAADEHGLVHGGFVFGLADYAAMLAVNDPLVVLAGAEVRFVRPVRVSERLRATAAVGDAEGRKRQVHCVVRSEDGEEVLHGRFTCVIPSQHVLAAKAAVPAASGTGP